MTDSAPHRYPLLLDLTDRPVLVVGGGPVAARRLAGLLVAGADVTVVAPHACEDVADLAGAGAITWLPREARSADLAGGPSSPGRWWLVVTATGDLDTDAAVAAEAERLGIWCVRSDRADASSAHVPAVAHGPDGVQVAVSGGGDPGRARAIRDAISDLLDTGRLPLRPTRGGRAPRSTPAGAPPSGGGRVVLVGGGPGDPRLLTVAGRQWLARADVVVTDRLGPVDVLAELSPDVEVIDVGKSAGNHPIPQDEINRILVDRARAGRTVVRLKGGDPFLLGRGGEEAGHCLAHGVEVEVVPGVTSAVAVPAAAGIPVTHRGITSALVIASGHAGAANALAAARSAPADATLVLLMGLSALARTAAELIAAGRDARTPVAVISNGWTPRQRTVTATLATIAEAVRTAALPGPAVTVVGEVVGLRDELAGCSAPQGFGMGSTRKGSPTC